MSNTTEQRDFSEETLAQLKDLLVPPKEPTDALDIVQSIADNDGLAIIASMRPADRNVLFDSIRKINEYQTGIADLEEQLKANDEPDSYERHCLVDDIEHLEVEVKRAEHVCIQLLEPIAKRVIGA